MEQITLVEQVDIILLEMKGAGFAEGTIYNYARVFKRMLRLAAQRKEEYYSRALGEAFVNDNLYVKTGEYSYSRYCLHYRCVQFIESHQTSGKVDWTTRCEMGMFMLKSSGFKSKLNEFIICMKKEGLKPNTIDGYHRLAYYFLLYMEEKKYSSFLDLRQGDVVTFIVQICQEHYQPTSLGAHLPGLKMFLKMQEDTTGFINELPEHLPKKRDILEIYSNEEYDKIHNFLEKGDSTFRNKAISLIAFETGLRAVDICNLTIKNIDWNHDCFHVIQEKTRRSLLLPLTKSVGNALIEYLLSERPKSVSEYVFLSINAPFSPLKSHSGCRKILEHIVLAAGIQKNGRISGTRITRHTIASRMLRHGVPLPTISETLGHSNPDSVMIYLTTNDEVMAECTLPLPNKEVEHAK